MVWYYALIPIIVIVIIKLVVPYIKKRYIDTPMKRCPICGNSYEGNGSCPRCGAE